MNMIMLSGSIGEEPEFSQYDSGKRRVSFSVALNQFCKDNTEIFWLPCYAWDSVCDRLQRCQKSTRLSGRKINIAGTLTRSSWIDTKTGERKSRLSVNIQMFDLLPSSSTLAPHQPDRTDAEMIFDGKPAFPTRKQYSKRSGNTS